MRVKTQTLIMNKDEKIQCFMRADPNTFLYNDILRFQLIEKYYARAQVENLLIESWV